VGNAVGNNPIAYLIPCHRVIRASGELGGYRWGLERKTVILSWEASREIRLFSFLNGSFQPQVSADEHR
jgi:AraC family transcriptional regulator of adaptative response/methylated-DNA-[protein]-cysteine methyltransferase